jgi:hypothetical protein
VLHLTLIYSARSGYEVVHVGVAACTSVGKRDLKF